ncbi:MAG: hypothetical protein HY810_01900 [Candidatus Omnitrophica bacterium]|nr:hypothetical protein [Candidatus Omnitrophota bacterium]
MKKTLVLRIVVMLSAILVVSLCLELAFRLYEKKYAIDTHVYIQHSSPNLHKASDIPGLSYELIPNASSNDRFFKINSLGIRDKEYSTPKPKDTYRILIIGDSVTFGTEYPLEITYPKVLEKLLQERPLHKDKFEVINAGICGYNAGHLSVFLGEYFAASFPRILPMPKKIDRFFLKNSAFYRFVNIKIYDCLSILFPERFVAQGYCFPGIGELDSSMRLNKFVFNKFFELSRKDNFRFVLLLVPELKNEDTLDPWIRTECIELFGFEAINLYSEFKNSQLDLNELRITPQGFCHFNEKGHEFTAEIIYEWLRENI